jgi:hypothetical protein
MNRNAYFRQYYWRTVETRRASAKVSRRKARERAAIIKIVCEAVTEARNDKAHQAFMVGLDAAGGLPLRLKCELSVMRTVLDCSSPVKHPTTPNLSGILVGETTRKMTLNLHRGSQPVGARRQSGSANGNGVTREK